MRDAETTGRFYSIAVQGSLLALLALLLGFTFNMSTQRYETRRRLVMDDANVLGVLWLQSSLLPEPQRSKFEPLLRQYIEARADAAILKGELAGAEHRVPVTARLFLRNKAQSPGLAAHRLGIAFLVARRDDDGDLVHARAQRLFD